MSVFDPCHGGHEGREFDPDAVKAAMRELFDPDTPDDPPRGKVEWLLLADAMRADRPPCFRSARWPGVHLLRPEGVVWARATIGGATVPCEICGVAIYVPPGAAR